jgi:poly(rC)-binding protein 2/3/4
MNLRLLVPTKVIGCLIGRGGSIVNDMRKKTKADIRISKGDKPRRASSSDELVEVSGEADKLRDALVQIVLRLREDVLKESVDSQNSDRDGKLSVATTDSLYGSSLPFPALLPHSHSQQIAPLGYDRRGETERGLEVFPRTSSYGYSSLQVADDDGYGGLSSYTSKAYEGYVSTELAICAASTMLVFLYFLSCLILAIIIHFAKYQWTDVYRGWK